MTGRLRGRVLAVSVASTLTIAALSGCTALTALGSAGGPRDADGRPFDPGPAAPSTCATRSPGGPQGRCVPVHDPPSRIYAEQAVNTLLLTRGCTSIEHVRCSERIAGAPSESDPAGLDAFSLWACVGQEVRGRYLHEDVIWSPSSGFLTLEAVTRDLSPALTLPEPNDPGLPNPYLLEESQSPTPTGSPSLPDPASR